MSRKLLFSFAFAALLGLAFGCEGEISDIEEDVVPTSIELSADELVFTTADASSLPLTVTAPTRPKVSGAPSWITVADGTYKDYKITYTVQVEENTTTEARSATLTVTAGSLSVTVPVSQAAGEEKTDDEGGSGDEGGSEDVPTPDTGNISKTLVTADATSKAQALYTYLYSLYGKKIISAVVANVNWNHTEADKIYSATGKYPAMNCYDFIHIYVPQNNWIDYTNLTPVTEWASAGGIVSLMWHFNVPVNKDTTPTSSGAGVTCTPSKTTFRAKNVFTSGSWENEWFYSQMDKVADIILKLQDKGIAAIWRPFHEGAGNATLKSGASWGTAWFWWGYDGAEVYKKLWTTMFDYFASKGIKNLIWVWTTQNYNGDSSTYNQDTDWYPGDNYVDIVGRDLYGYSASQNYTEYAQIQAAYPTKMVTLAECGTNVSGNTAFSSISNLWSAGAKWSWFMPWYGDTMPDTSWWKSAHSQSYVLTRDQVSY